MSYEILEEYIKQYIEANEVDKVTFCWHGGEPLLAGLDFYKKAMALQKKYAGGKTIENTLQTNGMLVDEAWCEFFASNSFLIGLSLDGPREVHDAYRLSRSGQPSFDKVFSAARLFSRMGVEFNTLSVVSKASEGRGLEIYKFLRDEAGSRYMQFLPASGRGAHWSVSAEGYGRFLCDIFDLWRKKDLGKVFVQLFETTLALWAGYPPGVCSMTETCGDALIVEHNGDVYCCDRFVGPETFLGNIMETPLRELYDKPERLDFGLSKRNTLPQECIECKFYKVCHGECPEHRHSGPRNVLCQGLKMFFAHSYPWMQTYIKENL